MRNSTFLFFSLLYYEVKIITAEKKGHCHVLSHTYTHTLHSKEDERAISHLFCSRAHPPSPEFLSSLKTRIFPLSTPRPFFFLSFSPDLFHPLFPFFLAHMFVRVKRFLLWIPHSPSFPSFLTLYVTWVFASYLKLPCLTLPYFG